MANFLITWNDAGDIVRAYEIRFASPEWSSIKGEMEGNVNDACLDKFSSFFANDSAQHLGVYCVTTESETLRIYYCTDALADTPSWTLQATYTLDDATVVTSARIVASDSVEGFVIASWRTETSAYVVRSTDSGATWTSDPIAVGAEVSDTGNDDAPFGAAVEGTEQLVSAIHAADDYRLLGASSTTGSFSEVTNTLSSNQPFPVLTIADDSNAYATIAASFFEHHVNGDMGIPGVTISVTGGPTITNLGVGTQVVGIEASGGLPLTLHVEVDLGKAYTLNSITGFWPSYGYPVATALSSGYVDFTLSIELRTLAGDVIKSFQVSSEDQDETGFSEVAYATPASGFFPADNVGIIVYDLTTSSGEADLASMILTGIGFVLDEAVLALHRVEDYTGSSVWTGITPGTYAAPTNPAALSVDPQNADQLAVLGKTSDGQTHLFTSDDQGADWTDQSSNDYQIVKRHGDTLILGGTDELALSGDLGQTAMDLLGDWTTAVGTVGTLRGFVDLVEEVDPETKAVPREAPEHFCFICTVNHLAQDLWAILAPVSLYLGEKREQVTDLSVNTPAGPLALTRFYRQNMQSVLLQLGAGWTHNHYAYVETPEDAPTKLIVHTPDGGTTYFTQSADDETRFDGDPGSTSTVVVDADSTDARYTLTAADKSVYTFNAATWLSSRSWPSGEQWDYTYDDDNHLLAVTDNAYDVEEGKRQLTFSYMDDPQDSGRQLLQQVGDHTGRTVSYTYVAGKVDEDDTVSDADFSLLSTVTDVLGQVWTYDYYGQHEDETDAAQLNYLTQAAAPMVDTTGNGEADTAITLKQLTYTVADSAVSQITEQQGIQGESSPLLETELQFHQSGISSSTTITNETTAGITKQHLFAGEVYAGPKDAQGNYSAQSFNEQYRPDQTIDANNHQTLLAWSPDGAHLMGVIDALGNNTTFEYDDDDRLTSSQDAQGRQTDYTYGDTDNPRLPTRVKVIDTDGTTVLRWQEFSYEIKGRLIEEDVIDPADGTTALQTTTRTYYPPSSGDTGYDANGAGLLQSITQIDLLDAGNNVSTTYTYDSAGRVVKTQQSSLFGSCQVSYTVYDDAGNVVASICNYSNSGAAPTTAAEAAALYDPDEPDQNHVTTYAYDTLNRRVGTTVNAGADFAQTTLTFYDALNRVVRTISSYVNQSGGDPETPALWVWNASNGRWEVSADDDTPIGHGTDNTQNIISDTAYNERGLTRLQRDPLGNVTLFGYDEADRLVKTVQNAAQPDYNNSYVTGDSPDPSLTAYTADSMLADQDIVTEQLYDPAGNLVKTVDALGHVTFTVYDALNRPVKTVRSASVPDYDIGSDLSLSSYTLAAAPDQDLVETTQYDALGRVIITQDALGNTTLYGYDALGRQVKTIQSASQPDYNLSEDPDLSEYALVSNADQDLVTITAYDVNGRVLYSEDVNGARTWTGYDGLGRAVKTIANAQGTATDGGSDDPRSDSYSPSSDPDKDLVTLTVYNSDGLVQSTQDPLGRVIWYVYDSLGRQVKVIQNCTYTSGTPAPEDDTYVGEHDTDSAKDVITKTVYDAQGRVASTVDSRGNATDFTYDILGRRTQVITNYVDGDFDPDYPDEDLIQTTAYDLVGRVSSTVDNAGNETRYQYDLLGRRTETVVNYDDGFYDPAHPDQDLISTTTYNQGGQVVSMTDVRGTQTSVVYDAAGRRLEVTQADGTPLATTSYTCYDKGGWVLRTIQNYVPDAEATSPDAQDGSGNFLFAPATHGLREDQNLLTTQQLDRLGRVIQVQTPGGGETHTFYRKDGSALGIVDPEQTLTVYRYDQMRRRTRVVQGYETGPIAFSSDRDGQYHLYLMDELGTVLSPALTSSAYEDLYPTWSPDGQKLAFSRLLNNSPQLAQICVVDRDGSNFQALTADTLYSDEPSWSPDGSKIACTRGTDTTKILISVNVDGSGETEIFVPDSTKRVRLARWSPDGTKLALSLYQLGVPTFIADIYTVNADGTGLTQLTFEGTNENEFVNWSPDGQQLIFVSNRDGHEAIYAMDAQGQNTRKLFSFADGDCFSPSWSPDGSRIVFYANRGGNREVYTILTDGSDLQRLTVNPAQDEEPIWSPQWGDPAQWGWNADNTRWEDATGAAIDHGARFDRNVIVDVTYDKAGRMVSLRDPRGNVTTYEYDLLNRRTSLTNALSQEWLTTYADVLDSDVPTGATQVIMTYPGLSSGGSYEVTRQFDRLGRLSNTDYGAAETTPSVALSYDAAGNRVAMTETGDAETVRETTYGYDNVRRLTSVGFDEDGDGTVDETVAYGYDAGGLRTQLTLPGDLNMVYNYDAKGQLTSLTDWDGQAANLAYDNAGRSIATLRDNGLRSRYQYDVDGHLVGLRHVTPSQRIAQFAYVVDARGNRIQAQEMLAHPATTSDVTIAYDDPSLVLQGTWAGVSSFQESTDFRASLLVGFLGDNATLTMGTGPDQSLYDVYVDGSLWQSFDGYAASASEVDIDIALNADTDWLTSPVQHSLEIRNRAEHNAQSSGYKVRFKQLVIADQSYDLQTMVYTYDALSRLTEARYAPGLNAAAADADLLLRFQYSYDLAGNRTEQIVTVEGSQTTTDYSYTDANQLTSDGTNTLTYDANGNLTSDGVNSYTWDRANRMLSMGSASYAYDGAGNRISQTVSSVVTNYLLDLQPGLANVLQATQGANTTSYVHAPRGIHSQKDASGNWEWMLQDGLGSVRSVVDSSLNPLESRLYEPYGVPFGTSGTSQTNYGFTGEMTDANNLLYLRARYYAPSLGVFTGLDPLETANRYGYADGNPINLTDPTGLQVVEGAGLLGCLATPGCGEALLLGGAILVGGILLANALQNTNYAPTVVGSNLTTTTTTSNYTPLPYQDYTPNLTGGAIANLNYSPAPANGAIPYLNYTPAFTTPASGATTMPFPGTGGFDPRELGDLLGTACGAGLLSLLWWLAGVRPIDRATPNDNPEDPCDNELNPTQAAHLYASISRELNTDLINVAKILGKPADPDRNLRINFAFTRVRNIGGGCSGVAAISNVYGYLAKSPPDWVAEALNIMLQSEDVQFGGRGTNVPPPDMNSGHAETNLYNLIQADPFFLKDTLRAIGISNPSGPCDGTNGVTNCQQFFSDKPIVLGWIDRQGNFQPPV